MAGWIGNLREGAWLTAARMRRVALVVLAAGIIGAGFLIATSSSGLNDRFGRPLGTDFASFYAAGSLANEGRPEAVYDRKVHFAREQAIFGAATSYYSFQYPPLFLLIAAFLARTPYLLALALWQGATLALYLWSIRAILLVPPSLLSPPRRSRFGGAKATGIDIPPGSALRAEPPSPSRGRIGKLWLLLALAFPAVLVNLGHGQNGFLTAALFGGALAMLDSRPLLAGILFGCLAYKPQFGVMIPLVLLTTGRWRVIAAAAATVFALVLATLVTFGPATWQAFFTSMPFTRAVLLEQGEVGWHKMQSVFAWVRLWGGPVTLAYSIQAIVTIAVAAVLVRLWHSGALYPRQAAALAIGSLLATPFCLDYDLMLLAPAIAFLAANGLAHGFAPYEKTLLAILWIVPLIARSVAGATSIPLAVPVMLLALLFLLRCATEANVLNRHSATSTTHPANVVPD
jgi:hypothetical protein